MKNFFLFGLILLLTACNKPGNSINNPAPVQPLQVDCVPGAANCSELIVQGDPYYTLPGGATSPFNGYADPSIRKDLQGNILWMSYSWPNMHINGTVAIPAIDNHLAKSTDGGNTWTFVKVLWPSVAGSNAPAPSQTGYMESEASNILPVLENNVMTWYGVRVNYFIANISGNNVVQSNSFQVKISKATTAEGLSNAPSAILTSFGTNPAWLSDQNLSGLSADVADVQIWNEPAMYYENGTLYLSLVSFIYDNTGAPVMSKNNVYVFSTTPNGDPASWAWSYRGKLSGSAEATELGGQRMTQVDIAKGIDGKLLMVATPDEWNSAEHDFYHKGCKVVEIKSLATPALERNTNGQLKVRAVITASDANSLGSAASAYDPNSSTGVLFTRRTKTATEFTARIWKTGLKP